jgi:hypothetical protein
MPKDANPGGPGGRRRKIQTNVPRGKTSHGKSGGCQCPMAAAVQSVKRGKFRLARRYAVMSVRLIAARLA